MPPRFAAVQIFCMLNLCTPFYFFVQPRPPDCRFFQSISAILHTVYTYFQSLGKQRWPQGPVRLASSPFYFSPSSPSSQSASEFNILANPKPVILALFSMWNYGINFRAVGLGSTCHLKIGIPKQRFTMLWRKNLVLIVFVTYLLASKVKSSATPTAHGRLLCGHLKWCLIKPKFSFYKLNADICEKEFRSWALIFLILWTEGLSCTVYVGKVKDA
jgi:hypothetical protein